MSKLTYVLAFVALLALAHAEEPETTKTPSDEVENVSFPWPWHHNTTTVSPPTSTNKNVTTMAPLTTVIPPVTTVSPNITTTSTTTELPTSTSTTTELPTSTSTAAPVPTTTAAPTTTPPPTPAPTPNTTTTEAPTTTAKPTPMPTPPPAKDPETGNWTVNFPNQNYSCILAKMAIQIEIQYVNTEKKNSTTYIEVPKNATGKGLCSRVTQSLTVSWGDENYVSFNFKNETTTYGLDSIEVKIKPDEQYFPGLNSTDEISLIHKMPEYNTTMKKSYKCSQKEKKNLTSVDQFKFLVAANLYLSNLQLEAYHNTTNAQGFSDAVDCIPFDTPDIVPIAAGCALAVLIIVVLLAYLLGRRRSQARGYLSMFTQTKREEDYIPMKNLSCFN